jgi:ribonuclease Z
VHNYTNHFEICVQETDGRVIRESSFICSQGFERITEPQELNFGGTFLDEPSFYVRGEMLDHGIPSLGFALVEREHLGVNKDGLKERSLVTGSWLADVKQRIRLKRSKDEIIEAPGVQGPCRMSLDQIEADLIIRSPGQRIAYVADCAYNPGNREKIIALAKDADYFFCEAAFLDEYIDQAEKTRHLTARQAGELATAAGARRLIPYHFSPRYQGKHKLLLAEAEKYFQPG